MIMLCVSVVRYSIALNCEEFGPIVLKRELRQVDPLSPYLFILCFEGLTALFHNAEWRCEYMVHEFVARCLLYHISFLLMIVSSFLKEMEVSVNRLKIS